MTMKYNIKALTPIFSYGADPYYTTGKGRDKNNHAGTPEIRAASIRGQLRWWMESLGYPNKINAIFGTSADGGVASRVIVRISDIDGTIGQRRCTQQHHWSTKTCYLEGTSFSLQIIEKRDGLKGEERQVLKDTIEAWLLMGTLGSRGTRAAGSLDAEGLLMMESSWIKRCRELLKNSGMHLYLGRTQFANESSARQVICDTLAEDAFNRTQPLGGIRPRKTSPLRMRVVKFEDNHPGEPFRIASLWINKDQRLLHDAIKRLQEHGNGGKTIGHELNDSLMIC